MTVEEYEMLDHGILRQLVHEIELRDRRASAARRPGIELANTHEPPGARLL